MPPKPSTKGKPTDRETIPTQMSDSIRSSPMAVVVIPYAPISGLTICLTLGFMLEALAMDTMPNVSQQELAVFYLRHRVEPPKWKLYLLLTLTVLGVLNYVRSLLGVFLSPISATRRVSDLFGVLVFGLMIWYTVKIVLPLEIELAGTVDSNHSLHTGQKWSTEEFDAYLERLFMAHCGSVVFNILLLAFQWLSFTTQGPKFTAIKDRFSIAAAQVSKKTTHSQSGKKRNKVKAIKQN
jgi:hypothetical protein